eukprot:scaffold62002_cov39-Phaeocystis_antarctica.AAC.1
MRDDPTSAFIVQQQVGKAARDLRRRVGIRVREHLRWRYTVHWMELCIVLCRVHCIVRPTVEQR